jgi:hypothetical protein
MGNEYYEKYKDKLAFYRDRWKAAHKNDPAYIKWCKDYHKKYRETHKEKYLEYNRNSYRRKREIQQIMNLYDALHG